MNCSKTKEKDPIYDFFKCLRFAAEAHIDQKRKDVEKTPYINHPIGVALIITEEAGIVNLELIEGCLLHDTIEDTAVKLEEIVANFGNYVGDLVQEVTDDKTLPKQQRKDLQVVHAPTTSYQGKLVKMADKLYNLRDLEKSLPVGWTEERRIEYFKWAFRVCEGFRGVCPKLEEKLDNIFKNKGLISMSKTTCQLNNQVWQTHDVLKPLLFATNFSAEKHKKNFVFGVANGVPYINHVIAVALALTEEAEVRDVDVLVAALLLDVVGKTSTLLEEVSLTFNSKVCELVAELTCDHSNCVDFGDELKNQINQISLMSANAKKITLAATMVSCRSLNEFYLESFLPEQKKKYLCLALELRTLLDGTLPRLEQELDNILRSSGWHH